jgi:guanylate kinase
MSARRDTAGSRLVVLSGPSGSGKTTIIEELRKDPRVVVSVSVTTRPPREGELDGRDYHFVDRARFMEMAAQDQFIETNDVFGNGHLYGSLWAELRENLAVPGRVYLMEVDVTGAGNLLESVSDLLTGKDAPLSIFIRPPSMQVLERRLRERGTDDDEAIARRLGRARDELAQAEAADAVMVTNESLEQAVDEIRRLVGLTQATNDATSRN